MFTSQAANDAIGLYSLAYAEYLEHKALEYASKFPLKADYFMSRSLSEALNGNDSN